MPSFEPKQFDENSYASKVDNFLVIFDSSSSMDDAGKFDIAQALVNRLNQTVPELGQTAGLRASGHSPDVSARSTELFYGIEKYLSTNFEKNFKKSYRTWRTEPNVQSIACCRN